MKIGNNYFHKNNSLKQVHCGYNAPSFGISFKKPKLITDIFEKHKDCFSKSISKIEKLHPGEYGTECKNSIPLKNFEEQFDAEKLKELYKSGFSTNTEGWADCFLKSSADNPLSTSSVYDCSVMYLYNKNTNTHFLYHSFYNTSQKYFDFLIKNFMREGFTKADILPGDSNWYARHKETLPRMLKAIKNNNENAIIKIRHYSSKLPEIVGYKGNLFEIPNSRTYWGFSDKGQASFKICDIRAKELIFKIKYSSIIPERLEIQRKLYEQEGYDKEISKVINKLIDEQKEKILEESKAVSNDKTNKNFLSNLF